MPRADDDGDGEAGGADLRHSQHNRQIRGRRTGRVTGTYLATPENPTTPANLANPLKTDRIEPRSLRRIQLGAAPRPCRCSYGYAVLLGGSLATLAATAVVTRTGRRALGDV